MKVELVVFDMAGTTVVDEGAVNKAFSKALTKSGYPVPVPAVDHVMGYRKIEAINMLLKEFYPADAGDLALAQTIHEKFLDSMKDFYLHTPIAALPFAAELFALLHQHHIKVALDTGFSKDITSIILSQLQWLETGLVDCVRSSDEVPQGRPHPYMIQAIMKELKLTDVSRVVKIGDTEVDINEGRNSGCGLVIAVTTGSYSRTELEKYRPDHTIDSLQEVPALLNLDA
ncbi:MAG: HAD hydrolase-like protein [Bacteroidota bacterium]